MNRIYLLLFFALCTCTATATSYTVNFKSSSGDRVQITTETNVADLCASDKDHISSVSEVNNVYQTADGILFDGTSGEASLELALNRNGQKNAISYVLEVVPYSGEDAAVSVNSMEQTITKHTTELKFRFSQPTKEGSLMIATKNNARFCLKSLTVDYVISNEIAFQDKNYTIDFGETFEAPILFKGVNIKDVKYTSSSKYVAEVDAATGAITVVAPGSAVITASATDPNNTSASVSASYTLNVLPKVVADGEDVTVLWNFYNVEPTIHNKTVTDVPITNLHGELFGVWYIDGEFQKKGVLERTGTYENRAIVFGESGDSSETSIRLEGKNLIADVSQPINLIVADLNGRSIFSGELKESAVIPLANVTSPFVVVRYICNERAYTKKFIIK